MKTTALLAILAVGAVVAVAGLAIASGTTATTLGMTDRTGSHRGMMGQDWSSDGSGGCPGMANNQFQDQTQNQYQAGSHCQYQNQQLNGTCQGQCSEPNDWNYSYDYDWEHHGMM